MECGCEAANSFPASHTSAVVDVLPITTGLGPGIVSQHPVRMYQSSVSRCGPITFRFKKHETEGRKFDLLRVETISAKTGGYR